MKKLLGGNPPGYLVSFPFRHWCKLVGALLGKQKRKPRRRVRVFPSRTGSRRDESLAWTNININRRSTATKKMAGNTKKKASDRTSLDSAATAETVDTSDDETLQHGSPPSAPSAVASSNGVNDNSNPPRRTSRKRKLRRPDFKGCQGVGTSEKYKIGVLGGCYRGKSGMKRAPKSAR